MFKPERNRAIGAARIVVVLLVAATFAVQARAAQAWGIEGHKIICAIANKLLIKKQQQEVQRLVRLYKPGDQNPYSHFATACAFADVARGKSRQFDETHAQSLKLWARFGRFDNWHFLNLSRKAKHPAAADCHHDCVLEGIEQHSARLADKHLEDGERAEALILLGHWVGDVHQPLHVSYQDDLGGTRIDRIKGGFYASENFHGVWDSGIIARARGKDSWGTYADSLMDIEPSQRNKWEQSTPLQWADESYEIAIEDDTDYCRIAEGQCKTEGKTRTLTKAYQTEFQPVVEARLQQAGVRLAKLIAAALK